MILTVSLLVVTLGGVTQNGQATSYVDDFNDLGLTAIANHVGICSSRAGLWVTPINDTIPWIPIGTPSAIEASCEGVFTLDTVSVGNEVRYYHKEWSASPTVGVTVEAEVALLDYSGDLDFPAIALAVSDGVTQEGIAIIPGQIHLLESYIYSGRPHYHDSAATFPVDTTQFHRYRIVARQNDVRVYVDDVLAIDGTGWMVYPCSGCPGRNWVWWGDGTRGSNAASKWRSVRYSNVGPFEPGETVPWDWEGSYTTFAREGRLESIDFPLPSSMQWTEVCISATNFYPGTVRSSVIAPGLGTRVLDGLDAGCFPIPSSANRELLLRLAADFVGDKNSTSYVDRWELTFEPLAELVADAGGPYEGREGEVISLVASNSRSSVHPIVQYEWDVDDDGAYDLASPDPVLAFAYGDDYRGVLSLRVTASNGEQATAKAYVNVTNQAPEVNVSEVEYFSNVTIRLAGTPGGSVTVRLFENQSLIEVLELERSPGPPVRQAIHGGLPFNALSGYRLELAYSPPEREGKGIGASPVWVVVSQGLEVVSAFHDFNDEQSIRRDSDHRLHLEPWLVNLTSLFRQLQVTASVAIADHGSDDLELTAGGVTLRFFNGPTPDTYPSVFGTFPFFVATAIVVDTGPGTLRIGVNDDDGGFVQVELVLA